MSGGVGETLERHTVCFACVSMLAKRDTVVGPSPFPDWTRASQLKLCNHRGRILPATLVEQDSRFSSSPSNLLQAVIGMLACHVHMPTTQ